ncbi:MULTISPECIES: hypothetical protein [unclassified Haloferax]|uniref:hypothetical protein n=1 Tax=unclassified Haloferax TaxID=2625095 RepID=UPI002874E65C|nr:MULTISPECIES: hypothetical protein [unclassified Haloferax]MDS0243760.1 hypothetical protein [Haloferax sp. S2CR25]MDS0446881.1 hypothetical protein [Haloferax sp. S2CR25-2]
MSKDEPNLKALFAGTQMTLVAIFLTVLGTVEALDFLLGFGILLALAGTVVVGFGIKR